MMIKKVNFEGDLLRKLNENQKKFIIAMLSSKTIAEAADKAGISKQTGYNYMNTQTVKEDII